MPDPLSDVGSGQASPFVTTADTVNATLDAVRRFRRHQQGQAGQPRQPAADFVPVTHVYVYNDTGATLTPFGCVTPSADLLDATDPNYPYEASQQPAVKVIGPGADTDFVLVPIEPIEYGKVGRAASAGVTVALVNVTDTTHTYAAPVAAVTISFASATAGPLRFLHAAAATGVQYVLCRLENSAAAAGVESSNSARLTTSSGGKWKWVPQTLDTSGVWTDSGVETLTYNAVPSTIDGTDQCHPVSGLRVRMWRSATDDGGGAPQYEFLPIGMADATHPGLVSLADQTMGDGSKTFQRFVAVNSTNYAVLATAVSTPVLNYPFVVEEGSYAGAVGILTEQATAGVAVELIETHNYDGSVGRELIVWPTTWNANASGDYQRSVVVGGPVSCMSGIAGMGVGFAEGGFTVRHYSGYGDLPGGGAYWQSAPEPLTAQSSPAGHNYHQGTLTNALARNASATMTVSQSLWVDVSGGGVFQGAYYGFDSLYPGGSPYQSGTALRVLARTGFAVGGTPASPGTVSITDGVGGTLLWGATATGGIITALGSSTVPLANGGTGANLSDPGANRLWGWDDTDNAIGFWAIGSGLTYNHATHTLSASGSSGVATGSSAGQLLQWDAGGGSWVTYTPSAGFLYFNGTVWSNDNSGISVLRNWTDAGGFSHSVTVTNGLVTAWTVM